MGLLSTFGRRAKQLLPGVFPYYCTLCESRHRSFLPFGDPRRQNALCPTCGALERHRLMWPTIAEILTRKPGGATVLHFAPEPCLRRRLLEHGQLTYVSVDLAAPGVSLRGDITALGIRSASVDLLLCSHVLEHVPDDMGALAECRRVLRADGTAVFAVPWNAAAQTLEDPSVTSPSERRRLFGQADHVRLYGHDFPRRLSSAGFAVSTRLAADLRVPVAGRLGVSESEPPVYVCSRIAQ